jgi:hypothetical protein
VTPADIERVFGRSRLRMVTGDHVEVFREASLPGERRRYTKRFLATSQGDFREWTEREWRILARLIGHGIKPVPDVVQFDRGAADRPALVQTYDAGITVDHWATLLPLERDGALLRNVFEECAHWWALARHCLIALDAIHELRVVHLDLKADNVCIPAGPVDFDPGGGERSLHPRFEDVTLIDFAFSLVSGERLQSALPIAAQLDYEYQSPRLLRALEAGRRGDLAPTRQLDWRCDLFSLAAMLWRYLPEADISAHRAWTRSRHGKARALVRRLIEVHHAELPTTRPHAELIALASEPLAQPELRHSLQRGWTLAIDAGAAASAAPTPVTRIALPLVALASAPAAPWAAPSFESGVMSVEKSDIDIWALARRQRNRQRARKLWWTAGLATGAVAAAAAVGLQMVASNETAATSERTTARAKAPLARAPGPETQPMARTPVVASPIASAAAPGPSSPAPAAAPQVAIAAVEPARVEAPPAATVPAPMIAAPAARVPPPQPAPQPAPARAAPVPARVKSAPVPSSPLRGTRMAAVSPRPLMPRSVSVGRGNPARATAALAPRGGVAHASARPPVRPAAFPLREAILAQAQAQARAQAPGVQGKASARETVPPSLSAQAPPPARSADAAYPWAVAGKSPPGVVMAQPVPVSVPPAGNVSLVASAAPAPVGTTPPRTAAQPGPVTAPSSPSGYGAVPNSQTGEAADAGRLDFAARANDLMVNHLPRLAQRAERLVARVLFVAGRSDDVVGDGEILDSAAAVGGPAADPIMDMALSPRDAQLLGDAARSEYGRRGASSQVLLLQVRAFGANPLDPEVAGNLAFLLLRQHPAQAEAARRLALHALTLHGARFPQGRIEDWATLAIASALSGRERDARNALLVSLALAPNLDRQCRAAIDAYALYGEHLRAPVEAMLYSAHASRRAQPSSLCEWPPRWMVSSELR